MVKFKIFETEQWTKDLTKSFEGRGQKIRKKLEKQVYPQLRENPYYGKNIKKLKGYVPETWRYRIGKYRFFYEIDDKEHIVYMLVAESRGKSY